jgi:hypothetical protein
MLLLKLGVCFVRRNSDYLYLINRELKFLEHERKSSDLQLTCYKRFFSLSSIGNWD